MRLINLILAGFFVSLSGCGGDSSNSPEVIIDSPMIQTGVFIGGPVVNIGYRTETIEGVTDAEGKYTYLPGEHVTFFIGTLEFPAVTATGIVTPLELAGTNDTSSPAVVNMIRLLQTLDKDGNPNTIEITEAAKTMATPVDFSLGVAEFAASTAVIDLISTAGQDTAVTELVAEADAISNFETGLNTSFFIDLTKFTASSVITNSTCPFTPGGWRYTFTNTVITFAGADTWNESAGCTLGAEETIPVAVADLANDVLFNCVTYPICKLSDFNQALSGTDGDNRAFTSTISFDQIRKRLTYTKTVAGTTYTEVISLYAMNDATAIVGVWTLGASNDYNVIVFLDETRYLVAHSSNSEFDADLGITVPVSAEYGTYSWNTITGAISVNALGQSDGEGGLSNPRGDESISVDGSSLTLTDSIDGSITATKIASANSIIGAWSIGAGTDYSVLVFLDETRYLIAHTNNSELDSVIGAVVPVSAEYGTYVWDATSGAFSATTLGQSDGQGGLSNPMGDVTIAVNGSSLILTDSIDGAITINRVE